MLFSDFTAIGEACMYAVKETFGFSKTDRSHSDSSTVATEMRQEAMGGPTYHKRMGEKQRKLAASITFGQGSKGVF